jgi:hypothetical protein
MEKRHARYLDCLGNAICLCPDHFAQWRHAAIEAPLSIDKQIREIDLPVAGETGEGSILFIMLGQDVEIKYCEKHLLELQAMMESSIAPVQDSVE